MISGKNRPTGRLGKSVCSASITALLTTFLSSLTSLAGLPAGQAEYKQLANCDLQQLQDYIEKFPGDPQGHFWMGRYCQKNGLFTQSGREYSLAVKQTSANSTLALQLLKQAVQAGHLPMAIALQSKVQAAFPDDPYVLYLQGVELMKEGRLAEAEPVLILASKGAPEIVGLPTALGVFALGRRQYKLAMMLADGDLAIQPDNYQSNLLKAGALVASGTCTGAVVPLSKVYQQTPLQTGIADALSVCLLRDGQTAEALDPTLVCLATRRPDAEKRTVQILKSIPWNVSRQEIIEVGLRMDALGLGADYHFEIGKVLDRLGRKEEAIAHYRECLTKAPRFAAALFNLGKDYETYLHDYKKALECYQQSLAVSPENSEYRVRYEGLTNRLAVRQQDLAWRLRDWLQRPH